MTRTLVYERSGGRCELCDAMTSDMAIHHRRPRGLGGSSRPDTNAPSNGLLVCGEHHRQIESYRTMSYEMGWLVRQSYSPLTVPVFRRGLWVLLDDEGGFLPAEVAS